MELEYHFSAEKPEMWRDPRTQTVPGADALQTSIFFQTLIFSYRVGCAHAVLGRQVPVPKNGAAVAPLPSPLGGGDEEGGALFSQSRPLDLFRGFELFVGFGSVFPRPPLPLACEPCLILETRRSLGSHCTAWICMHLRRAVTSAAVRPGGSERLGPIRCSMPLAVSACRVP